MSKQKLEMLKKLNDIQAAKVLDLEEKKMNALFLLAYFAMFSSLFVAMTLILMAKDPELYKEVLKIIAFLAGGSGLGYGIGKQAKRR